MAFPPDAQPDARPDARVRADAAAVAFVAEAAARRRRADIARAASVLGVSDQIEELAEVLVRGGRLTLNFHPDRCTADGATVAAGLLRRGRYVSQYVTGISNGGRSAITGGDRDEWEHRLFGRAAGVPAERRPSYGALDVLRDPHGGSPRFGSSFVVLHAHVVARATFCVGDSHAGPTDIGTADEPVAVLAGLVEQAAAGRLLDRDLGLDDLLDAIRHRHASTSPARCLDGYVEAQVHGGVDRATDVEAIIVDPSFAGTDVEADLTEAGARYGFALDWHRGSELGVDAVPTDVRGPTMPDLARRVAGDRGVVDAAAIGRAARAIVAGPPTPQGDPPESALQQLKYLWHVVLARGSDRRPVAGGA